MATFHCPTDHAALTDSELTEADRARGATQACPECGRLFDENGNELGATPPSHAAPTPVVHAPPVPAEEKPRPEPKKKLSAEERKKLRLQKRLRLEEKHNPYFAGR